MSKTLRERIKERLRYLLSDYNYAMSTHQERGITIGEEQVRLINKFADSIVKTIREDEWHETPAMPQPNWDEAAYGSEWAALEPGMTYWVYYATKPTIEDGEWVSDNIWCNAGGGRIIDPPVPLGIDWRMSLQRKPQKTA